MSDDVAMKTTHHGVEIELRDDDRFYFTLGGKERSSATLTLAKKAIDTEPKEKRAPVKKFKAYYLDIYSTEFETVEVGTLVDNWDGPSFWISKRDNTERRKVTASKLYEASEENNAVLAEITTMDKEIGKLKKRIEALRRQLRPIEVPK